MIETYPCGCSATGPAVPTYCPTHDYFETNCAGAKCVATTTGCQRGHCQLKNFNPATGQFTLMTDQGSVRNATELAKLFHDTYERLAPSFGYETRTDTRQFDPDSPNGRLMIAVCEAIRALPDQKD